jgi:pSer/pThr/pTyr-binding forkhead associated (FHA) protein
MMDVRLVMFKADGQRREFKLPRAAIIGRGRECHVRIPLGVVSQRHCLVATTDDGVVVQDLKSTNGTFVNEQRVTRVGLHPGDVVTVGPVHFVVVIDGSPEIVTPTRSVLLDLAAAPEPGSSTEQTLERDAPGPPAAGSPISTSRAGRTLPHPQPRPVDPIPEAGGHPDDSLGATEADPKAVRPYRPDDDA